MALSIADIAQCLPPPILAQRARVATTFARLPGFCHCIGDDAIDIGIRNLGIQIHPQPAKLSLTQEAVTS
jgi:hypothetical protein